MGEAGRQRSNKQFDQDDSSLHVYRFHFNYEVKNENNEKIGVAILMVYYGNLWESILDRMNHQMDGHMFAIQHQGNRFKVYRKLQVETHDNYPKLRLIS